MKCGIKGVVGGPQERRLINDLMANYNKLERPVNYNICHVLLLLNLNIHCIYLKCFSCFLSIHLKDFLWIGIYHFFAASGELWLSLSLVWLSLFIIFLGRRQTFTFSHLTFTFSDLFWRVPNFKLFSFNVVSFHFHFLSFILANSNSYFLSFHF